jgi:hypothetical protein
VIEG